MKVVVVTGPTEHDWLAVDSHGDLDSLQGFVGGDIEALPLDGDQATVYLNEEGKLFPLPVYAAWVDDRGVLLDLLHGPLVILGPMDEDGRSTDVTDEALAFVKRYVKPASRPYMEVIPCE